MTNLYFHLEYLLHYNLRMIKAMKSKIKNYDGSGEVNTFLEKISLHSALKGYDGQKAAQYLASKLEGRALDIYMRLSSEDKKKEEKIREELLKEFERGHQVSGIARPHLHLQIHLSIHSIFANTAPFIY